MDLEREYYENKTETKKAEIGYRKIPDRRVYGYRFFEDLGNMLIIAAEKRKLAILKRIEARRQRREESRLRRRRNIESRKAFVEHSRKRVNNAYIGAGKLNK